MNNSKIEKKETREPTEWKPIDVEKFNKNTEIISKVFRSDPKRLEEDRDTNNRIET